MQWLCMTVTRADWHFSASDEYTSTSSGLSACMPGNTCTLLCLPLFTSTYLALVAYWVQADTAILVRWASTFFLHVR